MSQGERVACIAHQISGLAALDVTNRIQHDQPGGIQFFKRRRRRFSGLHGALDGRHGAQPGADCGGVGGQAGQGVGQVGSRILDQIIGTRRRGPIHLDVVLVRGLIDLIAAQQNGVFAAFVEFSNGIAQRAERNAEFDAAQMPALAHDGENIAVTGHYRADFKAGKRLQFPIRQPDTGSLGEYVIAKLGGRMEAQKTAPVGAVKLELPETILAHLRVHGIQIAVELAAKPACRVRVSRRQALSKGGEDICIA